MNWAINIEGHDDLETEAKEAFENGLVAKVLELVDDIKSGAGITVERAHVVTNTTGEVDALAATEGDAPATEGVEEDSEEAPDTEPGM